MGTSSKGKGSSSKRSRRRRLSFSDSPSESSSENDSDYDSGSSDSSPPKRSRRRRERSRRRRRRCRSRRRSRYSEDSDSSDDEIDRERKKKRSSSKRITDEDIAAYLAKKSQENVMKVVKEVQLQTGSNHLGDSNLTENHHSRRRSRDSDDSNSSDDERNRQRKKKRSASKKITEDIAEYLAKKAKKKAMKAAKQVQSQTVTGLPNDSTPLGDCTLKEVQLQTGSGYSNGSNPSGDSNLNENHRSQRQFQDSKDSDSSDDGGNRECKKKRSSSKKITKDTAEHLAKKSQKKTMKAVKKVQSHVQPQMVTGHSNDSNPLGDCNLNEQQFNIMSSGAGNSNLSSLQPSTSVPLAPQPLGGKAHKEKMKVIVEEDGSVVGEYSKVWNTRTGKIVRAHIPISYTDWRRVPTNLKDNVWNALMDEFELNVPSEVARPLLETTWSQRFRTFKRTLRDLLKGGDPLGAAPKGVEPHVWREFVENESDPKKQLQNVKNAENRKKLEFSHCLGRRSYAQKQYIMQQDQPEKIVRRVNNWLMAHEHRDGTVLESAKSKYDEVKAVQNRRKGKSMATGEGCSGTFLDLDNDELTEVFGKDRKGGVRGMGSHVSKKRLIHIGVAKAKLQQMKKATEEADSMKNEIISDINSRLGNFEDIMQAMLSKLSNVKQSAPPVVTTAVSELGSDSDYHPSHLVPNMDNVFATMATSNPPHSQPTTTDKPPVILLDKFGKELAKGYVVTNATAGACHFKQIGIGEKKVYVEEVIEPDACLYDPPQGGHATLAGYVQGGEERVFTFNKIYDMVAIPPYDVQM